MTHHITDEQIAKLHDSMFPAPYNGHANVVRFARAVLALAASQREPVAPARPKVTLDCGEDADYSARVVWSDWSPQNNSLSLCLSIEQVKLPDPIGETGAMPGAPGFTMACFQADKVPLGTKLYTAPAPQVVPMTDTERADIICAVAAICTGTSSRNLAATAIEWTELRYGITAPAGGEA